MNSQMAKALNTQINFELFSSYLYLAMAAHCETAALPGAASWMRQQIQEELFHAMKFFGYVSGRGGRVALEAIDKPQAAWKSPLELFQAVLAHERKVTEKINELVELAAKQKDHATVQFLQWFVAEQVEEEAAAAAIVDKLKLIGKDSSGLFFLDAELGKRVFTPPAAA